MSAPSAVWPSLVPADEVFAPSQVAVAAQGHRLEYADGSTRLCATSGLWNVPLGYGNPAVADAVARATRDASYLSLFRNRHRYADAAADALVQLAGRDAYRRVIFSTAGGAAVDATMKLARQFWVQQEQPHRNLVVGLRDSYHGTMYGGHALSGDALLQGMYGLDRRTIRHVSCHDDGNELELLMQREGSRVAAVVIEPLLGSLAHAVSDAFLSRLLALREKHGFLVIADEVATGFARTGPMFASGQWASAPDALVLSKALTNGAAAASAIVVGHRIADKFIAEGWTFVHGETQAGAPSSAAAIVAVVEELQRVEAEATARALGHDLRQIAERLVDDGLARTVTGRGCFVGIVLGSDESPALTGADIRRLVGAVAEQGVIVQPSSRGFALIPALDFDGSELAELDAALRRGIRRFQVAA